MKRKADRWIVLEGKPILACRTRKQARAFFKKNKVDYPRYLYVGKVFDKERKIVLDL